MFDMCRPRGGASAAPVILALAALALLVSSSSAATVNVPSEQPTIQAGIDAAGHAGTVILAPGTYTDAGNIAVDMRGLSVTVTSSGGAGATIIDCESGGRAFVLTSASDTTAVIENLTIRNGSATFGGAISISAASPTIRDCVFESCAADDGGAIYASGSASPAILDCTFADNHAIDGGAVYASSYEGVIQGCTFAGNEATNGGALSLEYPTEIPIVLGCLFRNNTADRGGAIYYNNAETSIEDCSFFGNTADLGAGAYFQSNYNYPEVRRCSFVGNDGGGVYSFTAEIEFSQCVFAFDESGAGTTCLHPALTPSFTHCIVYGNAGGDSLCGAHTDNRFEDPLLCGLATGDLTLCANSPCIAANNTPWNLDIGAHGSGCGDCDSPVTRMSWGALKGIYRER
jgi:predicted outer membrane repeat protein